MNILIAEDDARTREGLRLALVRAGHRVIAAADGEAAVKLFQEEEPDIVCLDIMMPKMSGYEVCKTIRRVDKRVPVLFLSAKSEEVDRVLGLELGADDFLSKPFGVPELLARIAAIVRRCGWLNESPANLQPFVMGDLRIVPVEFRAYRGAQVIKLMARDVRMLRIFHERPGQVLDRNTLCDEAWGLDFFPSSRALDMHISQLRRKIEADPTSPKIITTVRGVGYRFE
jgi:DNA-binding response OmpR family regulator